MRTRVLAPAAVIAAVSLVTAADTRPPVADKQVHSIELPYTDPATYVPPGKYAAQFTAYCRMCHSPRLVLTQPRLPEKKWAEVVKKMVVTYGAQIPEDQEPLVVQYLTTIRGPEAGKR